MLPDGLEESAPRPAGIELLPVVDVSAAVAWLAASGPVHATANDR